MSSTISQADYWSKIAKGEIQAEPGGHQHLRNAEIIRLLDKRDSKIIDIGSGYAGLPKQLVNLYPHLLVVAYDHSPEMRQRADYTPYIIGSVYKINFPEKYFDVAVISCVLEYIEDEAKALAEVKRIAHKGIFVVPRGKHATCSQLREYQLEGLTKMLSRYGKIEVSFEKEPAMLVIKVNFDKEN